MARPYMGLEHSGRFQECLDLSRRIRNIPEDSLEALEQCRCFWKILEGSIGTLWNVLEGSGYS